MQKDKLSTKKMSDLSPLQHGDEAGPSAVEAGALLLPCHPLLPSPPSPPRLGSQEAGSQLNLKTVFCLGFQLGFWSLFKFGYLQGLVLGNYLFIRLTYFFVYLTNPFHSMQYFFEINSKQVTLDC